MTVAVLTDEAEKFWARVLVGNGCWEWQGFRRPRPHDNYGMVKFRGITRHTNRVAWELWHGRPPLPGLKILHRCDNPPCCRPDHLYEGTQANNVRDMLERGRHHNLLKTHCPHGHPYDDENTGYYRTQRVCKACHKIADRTRKARRRSRDS